jgi:hypothetical protein
MRFHLGEIPDSPDFVPDETWKTMHEPSIWGMQLIAFPIGILSVGIIALLWINITPLLRPGTFKFPVPIGILLFCFVSVLIIHELIHATIHPMAGTSKNTVLGFLPSKMFLYTTYVGELSRNRCLALLLAPFIVISIIPLMMASILHVAPYWLAYASILNAYLASGDLYMVGRTLFRIPPHATVRSQGWKTYWRS